MIVVACTFCEAEVDDAVAYRRILGWERKAPGDTSRKGGSDITLREHGDEFACSSCITRLRSGLNVAQESLV